MEEKGYFTLEDGTLSSSLKPKIKKVLGKRTQQVAVHQQEEAEDEGTENEGDEDPGCEGGEEEGEPESESESDVEI